MTALLLLFSGEAQAFNHTGWSWGDQLPIVFYVTDYLEDSLPQTPNPETGWMFQEEVHVKGFCNWHFGDYCESVAPGADGGIDDRFIRHADATCADIQIEYGGTSPGNEGTTQDGRPKIYFDDPQDIIDVGTNAVTYTNGNGSTVKIVLGETIQGVDNSDIVYNDNIDWSPDWEIEDGCQGDERSMESTGTHEIGHLLGMAHSCEQGELCTESDFLEATMFWSGPNCNTERSAINDDDIAGIQALYGPYLSWETSEDTVRYGPKPLEACVEVIGEEDVLANVSSIEWDFGDSTALETGETPCHTYESEGQFTVTMNAVGDDPDCGEWTVEAKKRAEFLVCDLPRPGFEVAHYDGLTYQIVNQTEVTTYGCVDGIQWEIFKGAASGEPIQSLEAWSPKIEFPGEGEYTVRLTAQGPAGEEVHEAKVTAEDKKGDVTGRSCSTGGGAAGFGAALMALALVIRRRD